jgi:hypothetical protein
MTDHEYTPTTGLVRGSYTAGGISKPYYMGGKEQAEEGHAEFDRWLTAHDAELTERVRAEQRETDQKASDEHMQKIAHRVMDVFENADEDDTADDVMQDVFAAIGLTEAFGAAAAIREAGKQ